MMTYYNENITAMLENKDEIDKDDSRVHVIRNANGELTFQHYDDNYIIVNIDTDNRKKLDIVLHHNIKVGVKTFEAGMTVNGKKVYRILFTLDDSDGFILTSNDVYCFAFKQSQGDLQCAS